MDYKVLDPNAAESDFRLSPVKKQSIVSDIVKNLIKYLTAGQVKPGERLPSERQLSEQIGVGRTTLREALKTLNVLGIIDVRPGDGNYLRESDSRILSQVLEWGIYLGERRIVDLLEARQKLEVDIVDLASVRRTEADLEELGEILRQMKESKSDNRKYAEVDTAFHMKLAEISRNSILSEMLLSILPLLTEWIYSDVEKYKKIEISIQEHTDIYDAIKRGDSRAASIAMEVHMISIARRLKKAHQENMTIEES